MKKDETKNREYHRMYYQKHKEQARERARQAYHRKKMLAQSLPTILPQSLNTNFGSIRKVEIDGQTWFVAIDVANILGAYQSSDILRLCEKTEKQNVLSGILSNDQPRKVSVINMLGLLRILMKMRTEQAENFRQWLLPKIADSLLNPTTNQLHQQQNKMLMYKNALKEADEFSQMLISQGTDPTVAKTIALQKAAECYDVNLDQHIALLPAEVYLYVNQITKELGWKNPSVNHALRDLGYQKEVSKNVYELTSSGSLYGRLIQQTSGDVDHFHAFSVIQWKPIIINILNAAFPDGYSQKKGNILQFPNLF